MGCTASKPCPSNSGKYQTQVDDHTGTSVATSWEVPQRTKLRPPSPEPEEPTTTAEPTETLFNSESQESPTLLHSKVTVLADNATSHDSRAEPLDRSRESIEGSIRRRSRRRQSHRRRRSKERSFADPSLSPGSLGKQSVQSLNVSSSTLDSRLSLGASGSEREMGHSSKSHDSRRGSHTSKQRRKSSQERRTSSRERRKRSSLDDRLSQSDAISLSRELSDKSFSSRRSSGSSSQILNSSKRKDRSSSSKTKRRPSKTKRLPQNEHRQKSHNHSSPNKPQSHKEKTKHSPVTNTPNTAGHESSMAPDESSSPAIKPPTEQLSSANTSGTNRTSQHSSSVGGPSQHSSLGAPSMHSHNSLNNYLPTYMKAHQNSPKRVIPEDAMDAISLPSLVSFSAESTHEKTPEERNNSENKHRPSLKNLVQKLTPSVRSLEFEAFETSSSEEGEARVNNDNKNNDESMELSQETATTKESTTRGDKEESEIMEESDKSLELKALDSDESDAINSEFDSSDPTVQQFNPLQCRPPAPRMSNSMSEVDRIHLRKSVRGKRSSKRSSSSHRSQQDSHDQVEALKAAEAKKKDAPPRRRKTTTKDDSSRRRHTIEGHNKKTLPSNRSRRSPRKSTGDIEVPRRRSSSRQRVAPTIPTNLDRN